MTSQGEKSMASEALQKLLQGEDLAAEDERAVIDSIAQTSPKSLPSLCHLLANHRRQLRGETRAARDALARSEAVVAQLLQPPWYPADVLEVRPDRRLEVVLGGRRQVVVPAPELDLAGLRPGDEVLLSREQNAAIARSEVPTRAGVVGVVAEVVSAGVVLTGVADEEIVAACAPDLAAVLRPGERVLYRRESQVVLARLGARVEASYVLQRPPRARFAEIGGLDGVIARIRRDLDLHLRRREVVDLYRLRPLGGVTLVGPPGNGKTLIAGAIGRHLEESGVETRFLHVKAGALRGMFYGESEKRIRELFALARRAPGLVVIFFDEVDSFGLRGVGIGHDIDGRVLGALLEEIDGLEPADRVLCVGATNRLDLCDGALVRPGRLGDAVYSIPRPSREAARAIFAKYLTADLPYAASGDAAAFIDAAVSYLYAPHGGAPALATVTLASGERREVLPAAVMSGALIASAVTEAKSAAADRHTTVHDGLTLEDVLAALDRALAAEAEKLRAPHAARRILDGPGAEEIVRVEMPAHSRPARHRYLRAV
jgi:proteasome-associated ATPase